MEKDASEAVKQKQKSYLNPPPPGNRSCPWLVICHGREGQRQTFYDVSEYHHHTKIIPDLHDKWICPISSHEWLFTGDRDSGDCCLWNPASLEKIRLPPLEDLACSFCFLSSSPGDPQSYVLVVDRGEDIIGYCKSGEDTFKRHKVEPHISCATMFKGEIFLLLQYCELAIVDIENSELRIRMLGNKDVNCSNPEGIPASRDYLVPSGEDLLIVEEMILLALPMGKIYRFNVFRMNFEEGTWEELKSIGDRAIFLSAHGGISCSPKDSGVKKNAIYFVEDGNGHIRMYDLEDQSISKVSPCSNINYRSSNLYWIML
ncbi:uncharacterized protein LOC125316640 [Rhodamnia argentea]|uniref:Uncharacterized protein LOC125316640 n=1 Tax=Rhodamnia argentea TaxID=178133 RepID=A0ABM3HXV7_9MYRT|nr:uncharacterized protein LOC125316640 [Rhodamnia argentea]